MGRHSFWARRNRILASMVTRRMEIPDRWALVKRLAKKYPLGLTTNSSAAIVRMETTPQFTRYFSAIVSGSDVRRAKPYPDMLLAAAKKLAVPPRECLMIGDAAVDGLAARAAGMKAILFSGKSSASPLCELKKSRPQAIVRNASQLQKELEKLGFFA